MTPKHYEGSLTKIETFQIVKQFSVWSLYLGGHPVPAQVLGVRVVADVVDLTLGTGRAKGQTVAVPLHFFHLKQRRHFSSHCKQETQLST